MGGRKLASIVAGLIATSVTATPLIDETATWQYASSAALLYWPFQDGKAPEQGMGVSLLSAFAIQDQDRARPALLKLAQPDLTDSTLTLMLTSSEKKGIAEFVSKEGDVLGSSYLILHTNNQTHYLGATIDTYLDHSTRSALGQKKTFKVSSKQIGLLTFTLPETIGSEQLQSAELLLHLSNTQYGNSSINVEQLSLPRTIKHAKLDGIAAAYPNDKGLQDDSRVYLADDFDANSLMDRLEQKVGLSSPKWPVLQRVQLVQQSGLAHYAGEAGYSAKAHFSLKKNLAMNLEYHFAESMTGEPEQAYMRYYLMLGPGSQVSGGGKLPGFSGTYNRAGWGGRGNSGVDGWSARGAFMATVNAGNTPFFGRLPIGNYLYEVNADKYGRALPWGSPMSTLQPGQWYCIEQHLVLNSPGKKDGQLEIWIDGVPILSRHDLHFRDTQTLKIEKAWFNFYFGGASLPKQEFDIYLDNIVIASEYIGPMQLTHP